MRKIKFSHKIIVTFSALLGFISLYAQGPNAPEAASFEPVDATDMVNLLTGDFTYVLPLLNVPSPEGGYPIALSYHAGIAMDQEASWVGLGWSLNPGAINRSVNGYPDDYNTAEIAEYFYDEGKESHIYNISTGYSIGVFSVGSGFSWGSSKSLGGYVSIGYGVDMGSGTFGANAQIGTDGLSMGVGYKTAGGLSVGVSASSNGNIGGNIGFNSNGAGFSVSASTSGRYGFGVSGTSASNNTVSMDVSLSSSGVGLGFDVRNRSTGTNKVEGGAGIGFSTHFQHTMEMGDYTNLSNDFTIPILIPTQIGIFSFSFGKQEFKYYLADNKLTNVNGPLYFNEGTKDLIENEYVWRDCTYTWHQENMSAPGGDSDGDGRPDCNGPAPPPPSQVSSTGHPFDQIVNTGCSGGVYRWIGYYKIYNIIKTSTNVKPTDCATLLEVNEIERSFGMMDIYEIPKTYDYRVDIEANNPVFPSYDKYNVQAQGLSGNMSSRIYENGALFGISNRENSSGYKLNYEAVKSSNDFPDHIKFNSMPFFYFDNEISTYIDVKAAQFNTISSGTDVLSYYNTGSSDDFAEPRRKNANYIEYFTNEEIAISLETARSKGFLSPSDINLDRLGMPQNGIGAFKITTQDGKTYHYSLPVYNREIITRTFGGIIDRSREGQSYFEKRQLEPYATHWLLTAVTGPDYLDKNNNGIADYGDYGYWTSFEYGKWSDAFVWKAPYAKDYLEPVGYPKTKTWMRGRKEIYYLDRIRTRTHTAVFVKSTRSDFKSVDWTYRSVRHIDDQEQDESDYNSDDAKRFRIPAHSSLKLEKILLFKRNDESIAKTFGYSSAGSVVIDYNDSGKDPFIANYNSNDEVIDYSDNWNDYLDKAIKVIDFNHNYDLAKGTPYNTLTSGRLTLNAVTFKGKQGQNVLPPYEFIYNNPSYQFNIEDKDDFGYYDADNSIWSLNQIKTPQGGSIIIEYENHKSMSVVNSQFNITTEEILTNRRVKISTQGDFGLTVGDQLEGASFYICCAGGYHSYGCGPFAEGCNENYTCTIVSELANYEFVVELDRDICPEIMDSITYSGCSKGFSFPSASTQGRFTEIGGIRVKSLSITDETKLYKTNYNYGKDNDGIGYITYLPFADDLKRELPYSAELPPPKVMYEYTSIESVGTGNKSNGKIQYKFNVIKEKTENDIKFGDFYELDVLNTNEHINSTAQKDVFVANYLVKDNLASIGQLQEVSVFNNSGHLLSKIVNNYFGPDQTHNLLGATKESFQSYKVVDYEFNVTRNDKWLINSSSRIKYPSLLSSSTEYKNGHEFTTTYDSFDEIVGKATKITSISSEGRSLINESVPAYTKYPLMGSKTDNITNKNMLSQVALKKTSIKIKGIWKPIGVGITTWNNDWGYTTDIGSTESPTNLNEHIWRKHKTFVWDGDIDEDGALFEFVGEDDNFNWMVGQDIVQTNSKWKNTSTITLYDHFSNPLEVRDINNNHLATKMCDNNSKVMATSNARSTEMFYSGAEYLSSNSSYFDGHVKSFGQNSSLAHTGTYSVGVSSGQKGFEVNLKNGEHRQGNYKISVWVEKQNETNARIHINGSTKEFNGERVPAGNWIMLNHYETLSSGDETVYITSANGAVYLDDFRLHPVSSSMTSYVHNEWDELTYILGGNNLATQYQYDKSGRLKRILTEVKDFNGENSGGFKPSEHYEYTYKNLTNQ